METTVKQRLVRFIKYKGLSQKKFEETIGVSNGYINNLKSQPRDPVIQKIILNFPELNRVWLLTGEGSMLATGDPPPTVTPDIPPDFLQSDAVPSEPVDVEYAGENRNHGVFFRDKKSGQLYISVPHMAYPARGEFPNLADSLEPMSEWGRELYKVDRMARGRYLSFDVRGDSMDNGMRRSLQNGDKILVRELELDYWRTLRAGDHRFWVLVFGTSVLIKEISEFDPVTGIVTCHSLNPSPEYHDFTLSLDDVRYLFYVIRIKPAEFDGI